ncbi:MAG: hypothetical protein JNK29_14255, partial [Anaerolineales bacterium]|nr:hypothetical protein [Anaerolineales bacterium]
RFASVADFLAAWKQALAEAPTLQAPAPRPSPRAESAPAAAAPPPAGRPFPVGLAVGGLALVIGAGVFFGVSLPGLNRGRSAADATPTAAAATAPAGSTQAAAPSAPAPAPTAYGVETSAQAEWRSWKAANRVRRLLVRGDELYVAGPGGITVWSIAAGSVLRRYTTGNGLPHANVYSIWVDDDGTLWAATEAGLGRLNPGSDEWLTYDTADGLDSNLVTAVTRAGEYLIVGTHYSGQDGGGLNLFDGRAWQAAPNFPSTNTDVALGDGKLANAVNVLLPAPDGVLWVGTEAGLGRYQRDTGEWARFTTDDGLRGNRVFALYLDQAGQLFVGTDDGAARFDGQGFQPTDQAPPDTVLGIVQDAQGRYYLSGGGGIWRYDSANVNWEEFSSGRGDLTVYEVTDAVAAGDGGLFFGTDGVGPLRYEDRAFTPWYIDDSTVAAWHSLILPAPDLGELWFIEGYGAYADRFDLQSGTWRPWTENACDCQPQALDAAGNQWGSRWAQGFVILSPEQKLTQVGAEAGLPSAANVRVIAPLADGSAWIGTEEDGLAFYDGEQVEFMDEAETGLPRARVWSLFVAADGALWAGVGEQISRRAPDGTWEHFRRGEALNGNFEWAADFAEDEDGGLWVATTGAGAYFYQDETWTQFSEGQAGVRLTSNYLHAVALDPAGGVWFGSAAGAAYFDGQTWATFDVAAGLINAEVFDVYVEPDGVVWFATAGGVTRYQP